MIRADAFSGSGQDPHSADSNPQTRDGWLCPHCSLVGGEPPELGGMIRRCRSCDFTFPILPENFSDSTVLSVGGPVTLTDDGSTSLQLERYTLLRNLGTGTQGRLLLAKDNNLDHLCVIKVLNSATDEWAEVAIQRLRNEAKAGVSVNHANVARVFDCDCLEDTWFFVMEFVEGLNLHNLVRAVDHLNWKQAVQIGIAAAEGLEAIHSAGLVHRDIKPGNIMLRTDGVLKIMDLGLVKIPNESLDVTRDGQLLGTPYYMAPEQFDLDHDITYRADLYGLGATLYNLVVGKPPFEGTGLLDIAQKHRHEPVIWPDWAVEEVPPWFRRVIETCLAKRPDHRYPKAAVLADALRVESDHAEHVSPAAQAIPRGAVVMNFRNMSGRPDDDWIGEAIAECLTSHLLSIKNLHVADRVSFSNMLHRHPQNEASLDQGQVLEAARLVGADTVVRGGFQCVGRQLRIHANLVIADELDMKQLETVSGNTSDLFALEDELGKQLRTWFSRTLTPETSTAPTGSTTSLEAVEHFIRGKRAFADGDYTRAIDLATLALEADPEFLDPNSLIGACYARRGDYEKAIEYHQKQELFAREQNDRPRMLEALCNLGVMYYFMGEYSLAYEFLDRARIAGEEIGTKAEAAKYMGNLGFVLMRLDRPKEAEKALTEAIQISHDHGDLVSLMQPYNGMGSVLLKQGRYTEAKEYYHRALALADELGDKVNIGVSHMNLGRCACLLDDIDEARSRFDKALETLKDTAFWNGQALVYEHRAEMHLKCDETEQALECIDQRIALAQRHNNNHMEGEAWEQKARVYEKIGKTDDAIKALKKSVEIAQRPTPHESLSVYLEKVAQRPAFQ